MLGFYLPFSLLQGCQQLFFYVNLIHFNQYHAFYAYFDLKFFPFLLFLPLMFYALWYIIWLLPYLKVSLMQKWTFCFVFSSLTTIQALLMLLGKKTLNLLFLFACWSFFSLQFYQIQAQFLFFIFFFPSEIISYCSQQKCQLQSMIYCGWILSPYVNFMLSIFIWNFCMYMSALICC